MREPTQSLSYEIDVILTAPLQLGDVAATLELDGRDPVPVVLRDGRFSGSFAARPHRLRLTTSPAPAGEDLLALPSGDVAGSPAGDLVDVETLFGHGVEIPPDGRLAIQVGWGTPCHEEVIPAAEGEGTRFGSFEHTLCAELIGQDGQGNPLKHAAEVAWFDHTTPLTLGHNKLEFGQIIALAGDFYAHLDERATVDFADVWPEVDGLSGWLAGDYRTFTLDGSAPAEVDGILHTIGRDRDVSRGVAGELAHIVVDHATVHYPARRYLALASQNHCHFAQLSPLDPWNDANNEALALYLRYHARALAEATTAGAAIDRRVAFQRALTTDAFACHFLTDAFASGHMRVPRRDLARRYGVLRGSLRMAHAMHAEDNQLGLWCTTSQPQGPRRVVWRAYGDGMLGRTESVAHLAQVQEAVRRSVAELFAAFASGNFAEGDRATALVPRPLPPGDGPGVTDQVLGTTDDRLNHWPLYWHRDGQMLQRGRDPYQELYTDHDAGILVTRLGVEPA